MFLINLNPKRFYLPLEERGRKIFKENTNIVRVLNHLGPTLLSGPFMSPKCFREFIYPLLNDVLQSFSKRGFPFFFTLTVTSCP